MPLAMGELARFEREAKVLAASAHLDIAGFYGLEDRANLAFRS